MKLLVKTVLYRIVGSLFTFLVAYLVTHKLDTASLLASTDVIGKLVIYYLYEVAWNKYTK